MRLRLRLAAPPAQVSCATAAAAATAAASVDPAPVPAGVGQPDGGGMLCSLSWQACNRGCGVCSYRQACMRLWPPNSRSQNSAGQTKQESQSSRAAGPHRAGSCKTCLPLDLGAGVAQGSCRQRQATAQRTCRWQLAVRIGRQRGREEGAVAGQEVCAGGRQ